MMAYTAKEKALRAEYSKTSRRIRQQLKRLTARHPDNTIKDWLSGEFPTLKEIGQISNKGLGMLTERAKRLYESQMLTIPGYEASLVQSAITLNDEGFDWVTPDNVESRWRFIDDMRARGLADIYGYRYFVEVYNRIKSDRSLTSEQLQQTVQDWTEYAMKYNAEVQAARTSKHGKKMPRAKQLKFSRKPQRNSSNNDYNA